MKLRSHLLVLTLATLLPMTAFAVIADVLFVQHERATFQRGAMDRTRALLTAVDSEVRGNITTLEAIATSAKLDARDLRAFYEEALRVLKSQPDWLTINLARPSGQQIVNVLRPYGTPLHVIQERTSLERVLTTGQPAVGNLVHGALTQQHDFAIRVPVVREGAIKYVLSAVVRPQAIARLLAPQRLPADWVGVVLDGNDRIVARTVAPERSVGERASESLRAALSRAPEGWFRGSTIEGAPVYTPYNRSTFSNWTVAMGIPADVVDAAARRTAMTMGSGVLVAAALAILLAVMLGRRIAAPIAALASAAKAIGHGQGPVAPVQTGVEEVGAVWTALEDASQAVTARAELQGRLAAIVESASDAIISYTLDGIILTWNPGATRLFGYTADEVRQRHISFLVPADRAHEPVATLTAVTRGESVSLETIRLRKDSSPVDVAVIVSPILDAAGTVTGVSAAVRDITLQKQRDRERADLVRREQEARAEAEAASRTKDEFLAVLSHELRTPLNSVFGWTQMLRSGQFDTSQTAHALDVIARNAHAQVQLIDDLLDVSRIVAGKMRLDVGPVDLRAVIEAALDAVRPASEAKAIRLQSVLDPRAGPVTGDPGRLQQALWNLLVNAVKFTSRNGRVQVHLQRINSHVEIVVSDTGQGIAPAVLPTIFERFRQGDSGTTRAHSGLGLGLALVRHLVELHGGSVQAHSAGPGQGATFTITLPISIAQAAPGGLPRTHPTATTVVPVVTGSSLIGLRVLVVDDDPDALEMTSVILQQAGADTLASRSAAEALTVVQAWRPDVIVADIEMPEEDGYAFIRKVRALNSDQGGKIPAIAVTAYGRPEDRMRALAAGFSMHLPKPVDPGELRTVVASLAAR